MLDVRDCTESACSYLSVSMAYLSDTSWMNVGAAVLLIARLIADVPKAYSTLREMLHKRKRKKELNDESN